MASEALEKSVEEGGMAIVGKSKRLLKGDHSGTQLLDKFCTGKQSSNVGLVVAPCMNVCGTPELTRR